MRQAMGYPPTLHKSVSKSGAGGFTFESGAGVQPLDSPAGGFGGFKFAEPSPSPSPAGGIFQTASGKNVTPSADAMRRARGMFEDDTAEFRFNPAGGDERTAQLSGGGGIFQTASGKGVAVSADAVRIARRVLGDDTEGTPQGDAPGFKFHTASGKEVTPSADARARGENLFGSVGTRSGPEDTALKKRKVDGSTPDVTPGGSNSGGLFQTGTGRAVTVSEDGMRRARSLLGQTTTSTAEAVPMEAAPTPAPTPNVPAAATDIFSTANGKSVAVSRAAMQRGARLFNNEGDISGDISGGERDATTPAREPPARAASNAAPKPAIQTGAKGAGGFKPPARTKQFNPPIRVQGNGARTPPNASPGGRGLATKHTGAGAAPQVHDLFASRVDRERLGSFFDYLKPGERPGAPSALLDAQVRAMSADTALGYRVRDEHARRRVHAGGCAWFDDQRTRVRGAVARRRLVFERVPVDGLDPIVRRACLSRRPRRDRRAVCDRQDGLQVRTRDSARAKAVGPTGVGARYPRQVPGRLMRRRGEALGSRRTGARTWSSPTAGTVYTRDATATSPSSCASVFCSSGRRCWCRAPS